MSRAPDDHTRYGRRHRIRIGLSPSFPVFFLAYISKSYGSAGLSKGDHKGIGVMRGTSFETHLNTGVLSAVEAPAHKEKMQVRWK
jgi:hypothetical protein